MILQLNNILKQIEDTTLFEIDQLKIGQGEKIGLIGKNGCGKSTLLKMIANNDVDYTGTIDNPFQTKYVPQLKKITSESGGEQTKSYLLDAFNSNNALLLLDEPSTNLDMNNIKWLINQINQFQGTMIIVSHDRLLLNQTVQKILEIEEKKLNIYTGNYDDYDEQKKKQYEQQLREYEQYQKKMNQLQQESIERNKHASNFKKRKKNISISDYKVNSKRGAYDSQEKAIAKSSKVLQKRMEQMEKVEKPKNEKHYKIKAVGKLKQTGATLIHLDNFNLKFGNQQLFHADHFKMVQGDKIAITGPNGSGKTTFIKQLIEAQIGGYYKSNLKIGYFAQNLTTLDKQKNIFENVRSTSVQDDMLIRNVLAALGFDYSRLNQIVKFISGGERVRLQIIKLLLGDYDMLILDEPTNFLDISTLQALEHFLKDYPGSFLIISHDAQFINNTTKNKYVIKQQQLLDDTKQKEYQTTNSSHLQLLEYKLEQMILDPDIDIQNVIDLKKKIENLKK
ncbi:ribosomal protection-like ABC-F family protein [Macrococcoides canis]|uniref:ribosomal protection-like ABC-F family protein n=1 Tax=Macrococcoides canis TaxID=1855823 RepID=UPI0020B86944|nr:ABC-F family ATP-binding cassette domain-containing protein [Macrococcus canis]UTH05839.1 ABC-F family ATP-binding cassette domain-containing protein [Macrococcus canis]